MATTSSSLLDALKAKSDFAWSQFVERYQPFIWSLFRSHGISTNDSTDLIQEVFLGVYKNIGGFNPDLKGTSFHAWLRGIVNHKVVNFFRERGYAEGGTDANRRLHELADPHGHESSAETDVDRSNGWVHLAAETVKAEFETRTWQAFWRTAVEEQSAADVARDLGMSHAAVRKAKSRVLRRLREEVEELPG